MGFQSAGDFLLTAAQKYKLNNQALGALICEKFRQFLDEKYPKQATSWLPQKFTDGVLFVKAKTSADRSALFLETHHLTEAFNQQDIPTPVSEIRITK